MVHDTCICGKVLDHSTQQVSSLHGTCHSASLQHEILKTTSAKDGESCTPDAVQHRHLIVVEQQAAEEGVRAAQGPLDLLAVAGNVSVAEHCDRNTMVLTRDGLCSLRKK